MLGINLPICKIVLVIEEHGGGILLDELGRGGGGNFDLNYPPMQRNAVNCNSTGQPADHRSVDLIHQSLS